MRIIPGAQKKISQVPAIRAAEWDEEREAPHFSVWRPLFWLLLLAAAGFYLRVVLRTGSWIIGKPDKEVLSDIALHVAIAFLVAAILGVAWEYHAKRLTHRETNRFRELVSRDVFRALLGRIVPPLIVNEINDVLHSEIARDNCKYRIIFKKPYPGMAPDYFVIRREVSYTVKNLLNYHITYVVRSMHSGDVDLTAPGLKGRFHLHLYVDEKDVPLEEGANLFVDANGFTRLEERVKLGPQEEKRITLHGEEPCLVSAGRNTYLHSTPVCGIEVEVLNESAKGLARWEVQMNHPARNEARLDNMGSYRLDRAFLPGQGFQVIWSREAELPTAAPTDQAPRS